MSYTLDSKVKIENNETLKECLDKKFFKWKAIIFKNPTWYNEEVLEYISYIHSISGKSKSLNNQLRTNLQLKYT